MPESAVYDPIRKMIYVSNVNHYAKDNNGFISRVSVDGQHLELDWLTGLHSPTGLAIKGDKLYAVDYDALVVIDLIDGVIVERIEAIDASNSPVLNDVAISMNGDVYVSGSRSEAIYQLTEDKLEVWLKDSERLKNANGLLVDKEHLLHGGEKWTVFDRETKMPMVAWSSMGNGLAEFDGITTDGNGGFIVTLIDDARLWLLRRGKKPQTLSNDEVNGVDLHFYVDEGLLFVPRVGNTLSMYRLVHSSH